MTITRALPSISLGAAVVSITGTAIGPLRRLEAVRRQRGSLISSPSREKNDRDNDPVFRSSKMRFTEHDREQSMEEVEK